MSPWKNFESMTSVPQCLRFLLLLLLLLRFSSLQPLSSVYTPPDKYFIDCGSETNITTAGRNFVGDTNSASFALNGKQSISVKDSSRSLHTSPLYQTARIFQRRSSYEFQITDNGTYLVRLHFYAFSSFIDLSRSLFNVSASGSSLLHNFNAQKSGESPVVKEFLLSISIGKFLIYFTPCQESSFGFVNAIEVFPAPASFVPDKAPRVTSSGSDDAFDGVLSQVLQTIYRINVGGPKLTPENDSLWRTWLPNKSFVYQPNSAENSEGFTGNLNYIEGGASEAIAPSFVYKTALEINMDVGNQPKFSNITWCFNVSSNAKHLVRVHFCDIMSLAAHFTVFNMYINGILVQKIDPQENTDLLAAPFYIDFVVDSDRSGVLNISVSPRIDEGKNIAFLNGLEIMEMVGELGSAPAGNRLGKKHVFVLLGSALGGFSLICIFLFMFLWRLKRRKQKLVDAMDSWPLAVYGGGSTPSGGTERTLFGSPVANLNLGLLVPLAEIKSATTNFDTKLLTGTGGFGKVYKGTLRDGRKVAVKRSEQGSGQGWPEFQAEILVLSKIRHRHLVSLIGYCDEGTEMILVYEFMEKGTLKSHLYESEHPPLSWKQRQEICIGAARGLHYLHAGSGLGIIHRDVKSSNILLDENLVAKVADFGLSKLVPTDQTHVSTVVKGSIGYLDPEYMRTQQLTDKSDVYSFGVVLLEVLCARPAIDPLLPREEMNLAEWGMRWQKMGELERIVDPFIAGEINPSSLRKFGETAEKCLQEYGDDRPTMGDVLWDLEYALQLQDSAVAGKAYEDSVVDGESIFLGADFQRFPSIGSSFESESAPKRVVTGDCLDTVTSEEVFSVFSADDGR